jgi:hypothetical protein
MNRMGLMKIREKICLLKYQFITGGTFFQLLNLSTSLAGTICFIGSYDVYTRTSELFFKPLI